MRKGFKILLYIICSILFLVLGSLVLLNTQWGQNFVRGRVEAYLKNKLKTEVSIGHFGLGFPKYIVLDGVLFLDQARDTLLAVGELKIDLNMLALIHKEVSLQQIVLKGVHSHIYRNQPDTAFNFTYIVNAFTGNPATAPGKAKDTTSSSLKIDLGRVTFDDIHVRFDDHTGGILFALNLDHLDLKMNKLDIDKMLFHIKELTVSGLQTTFRQDTSYLPVTPKDTTKAKLQLIADNVDLKHISFQYNNDLNKFLFGLNLGSLQLQLNKFSLEDNVVDVKKLAVNNTNVVLTIGKLSTPPAPVDTVIKIDTTQGWHVKVKDIALAGVNYKMDDENAPRQPAGIDYAHLNVRDLALNLKDLLYTSDAISGNVKHLAVKEQSGVDVKELRTEFNYNQHGATLKNLYLQTPSTVLQNHLEVHYSSLAALQKNTQSLRLNINVENSFIGLHDVLIFAPQLGKQALFQKYKDSSIKLEAAITGRLDSLNIAHFYVAGLDNTEALLNGTLLGLPDTNKIRYDLNITKLQSSRSDIAQLVLDSVLASVRLPDRFGVTGRVAGTLKDYLTELYFASTDGLAYIKGSIATSPGKNHEQYNVLVRTSDLNVGRIIKQDSLMGTLTATIAANGESFDVATMKAAVDGEIGSALIKGYRYHDIKLSGKIAAKKGNIDFISVDSNLQVQLTGQADFSGKYPSAKADIRIDSIDFKALKLYSTDFRARGLIHFDFPELNADYPRGEFIWWNPVVNADGKRYYLDSMYIVSNPDAEKGQNITANLDVMQATITGKTPLTKIIPIIREHLNRHYKFHSNDSTKNSIAAIKQMRIDTTELPAEYGLNILAHVIDKPMLHGLLPGLTSFDSIHIDAALTPDYVTLNVNAPDIVYGTTSVENVKFKVNGVDSAFTYKVTVDQITKSNLTLWYTDVHGNLDKDNLTTNISLSDNTGRERFAIKASMQNVGDSQIVQLLPGLKLNYKAWAVTQPNRIVMNNGGVYVQNFAISDSNQSIRANSDLAQINTPLKIDFNNFMLSELTDVISSSDTVLADGILGGNITIQQMTPALQATSDLQIQNLTVLGDTLGNLRLHVDNKRENVLNAELLLKGQGNDIGLTGSYYLQQNNGNDFYFNVDVNALAVHSFETITANQIRKSSGYLRGKLVLQGTSSAPQVTGELRTDNLVTTISQLNAVFKMPAEKVEFTKSGISFDNFTMEDSANNKAILNGTINTTDLSDIQLNMKVSAKNWKALNATKKDNKILYGSLLVTANLNIKGSASAPSIDGSLRMLKGTNVTVVNPETLPEIQDTKGIVIFMNMKDTARGNFLVPKRKANPKRKVKVGNDFNVNVSTDKEAQFTLITDQTSGDYLTVKGDATLNAAVTPGGTISLSGIYELHDGAYQLNYNFIKRKFKIKEGSTVTFAGDPIAGTNLDITAVYDAQIPPYDLVQREVTDPAQLNYYKQQLPFEVDLNMKGPVMTPRLTFDVELPENKVYPLSSDQIETIQSKLNLVRMDTSELNKQVFAVLVLGRFVSDDPFSNGAGTSASVTAMQSVSTFIGEQLNQAAGKFIKGVDFSVDLASTEDYTSGNMQQRTDLNLAASKQLLNNRLKLTIGNDFELQGPQTNNSQTSVVPTNLAADYLLTNDGKYSMRAYRRVYDEGVLEGFVTETGLNFIVNLNFNEFRDIFKNKKGKGDNNSNGK